jgi:hypothetical protein
MQSRVNASVTNHQLPGARVHAALISIESVTTMNIGSLPSAPCGMRFM